ncbi:SNARE associated Golgi domain containing protein [Amanita muscaria]
MTIRPPLSRFPASSSATSALTIPTLGRRRSTSCFHLNLPPSPTQPSPLALQQAPPSSMLPVMISRCLDWLHLQRMHARGWSTPTSSNDEPVLPLSASATKTSFGPEVHDEIHKPILVVLLLFPASTALVLLALSTLPITFAWPRTIADVAQLGRELHGYSQSGSGPLLHVMAVMAISTIWKHAWSIPGSVIWNVLAGALFSTAFATLLLTLLTTIGSVCASLLAMPLAPYLTYLFPKALDMTRSSLEGDTDADMKELGTKTKSAAWVRLAVLRLVGVVPWSGINIASGLCGVSISDCLLGSFIGSLPWTAVTCQIGNILQTLAITPSPKSQTISSLLTSREILFKLAFLSIISLAPILGRERLRAITLNTATINGSSEDVSGWKSIRAWRHHLQTRLTHQSRSQKDLRVLVQEKIALQELPS